MVTNGDVASDIALQNAFREKVLLTSVGRGYPAHALPYSFPGESEILGRGLQSDLVQLPAVV